MATFAWNTARHLELYFAAPCSGRVLHTLNIRLFPEQLSYIVDHAEDEVIFADRSLLKLLWPLVDGFETVKHIVVMDDGAGDIPEDDRILDYEELIADAEPAEFHVEDENQAAAMCYTSGTTGNPKGVVYSHRSSVLHSMGAMLADTVAVSERDVVHAGGADVPRQRLGPRARCGHGRRGARVPRPADDPGGDRRADRGREGHAGRRRPDDLDGRARGAGRPRHLVAARHPVRRLGGARKALSEAYREKLGLPILHAWGMTETSPLGSVCRIKSTLSDRSEDELADVRATQGIVTPLIECRIVEPGTTDELPWDGEARGELQVAGPWVAAGYYNDEREGDSFTEDGWLRTGDVATITPDGYIRLVDRTKDLVKSGGEWISSVELENEIMAHPQVVEAAVIGGARTRSGASARWPAWWPRTAPSSTPTRCASSCPTASPSGGSRSASNSSRKFRRPRSASSPRRRSGSGSVDNV